jgi:bacillolysin
MSNRAIAVTLLATLWTAAAWPATDLLVPAAQNTLGSKYSTSIRENGWIEFKVRPPVADLVSDLVLQKSAFGLAADDALAPRTSLAAIEGKDGVVRLDQTHLGHPVEGAEVRVIHDGKAMVSDVHGRVVRGLPAIRKPALSQSRARDLALRALSATRYAWEDPELEAQLKVDTGDKTATHFPVGRLLYARRELGGSYEPSNYRLAYAFEITTLQPAGQREVVVDAATGEVIRNVSIVRDAWGTVNTTYDGQRGFVTKWRGFPNYDYVLKDHDRGDKLHTLTCQNNSHPFCWGGSEVDDNDNVWSEPEATAHWAVQVAWDYFRYRQFRNGMNGGGDKIRIVGNYRDLGAFFTRYGGYDMILVHPDFGAMDVVTHEFTHGVISHTSRLFPAGESGALAESFGDIFGLMGERYLEGGINNWTVGEDPGASHWGATRSLIDPNSQDIPGADTYGGTHWVNPSSGGIHQNNGVQNHWFFLLANGGSSVNDNGEAYTVQAIGPDAAARIAFRNMTLHLGQFSTFADAREGAIAASRALYGECSPQTVAVANAWHAVGVGRPADPCVGMLSPSYTSLCVESGWFATTFSLYSFPPATVQWQTPWDWDVSVSPDTHTLYLNGIGYPQPGNYVVSATAIDASGQSTTRYSYFDLQQCTCDPQINYCP